MTPRRAVLLQLVALALATAMSLIAVPFLDRTVPIHWNAAGTPDAWGSPLFTLLMGPVILGGLIAGSFALVRRDGSRDLLMGTTVMAGFFVGLHGLVLGTTVLHALFPVRPLLALVFGLLAGVAPILARVEQNPWFGVRTPWTLGSRRVWRETHRRTGRLWLVGGLLGAAATLFVPIPLLILYLVGLALAPVAISYAVWLKLGR